LIQFKSRARGVVVMSFHAKLYGTEKEPVHAKDLNALTGCTLAWWYNREEQNNRQEVLASEILEAAGREVVFRVLREGIWETDICERMFRDAYKRLSHGLSLDWEGRDPKQEGRSFLLMLKNFLPEARRMIASALAIDVPFSINLAGIRCVGNIDLLYKDADGKLCLTKISFARKRSSQWLLDHDPELALQAAALSMGGVEGMSILARWPERLECLYLRDFLPFKSSLKILVEHPDQAEYFNVPLWSHANVSENDLRGPGFYLSRQAPMSVKRLEFSLKQLVAAVRGGRIVETFGDHCRACPWQERCLSEGDQLSPKEISALDRALASIPA
jgi:hypothetical protein